MHLLYPACYASTFRLHDSRLIFAPCVVTVVGDHKGS
jgi:hypothetical protein